MLRAAQAQFFIAVECLHLIFPNTQGHVQRIDNM